jgi:hypothetical protein
MDDRWQKFLEYMVARISMVLKFAIVVTVVAALVISGMLAAPVTVRTVTAQGLSTGGGDVTSFLQSAKTHLIEAMRDIKMGNSQAALTEINMTHQGITSAGLRLNASIICDNVNNEGFCEAPPPFR